MKRVARTLTALLLSCLLLFVGIVPVLAAANAESAADAASSSGSFGERVRAFFKNLLYRLKALRERIVQFFRVREEQVKSTRGRNAIHQLKSVTDTICDSYIITTEDGKVIVIDGGHYTETAYFLAYLQAATGRKKPHIDAWFLSHAHDDHCEVFLDVAEHYSDLVTFDKVYANFPEASFYEGRDDWAFTILGEYYRLLPGFADKAVSLREGDVLKIGAAVFTVFYTFNPAWTNCNEGSTIMRMDLGGTGVMFTGDAGENAGNYVVDKYANSGLLDCDYCKMAHHGQDGVGRNFYEAVSPEVCLWPTPSWVWDNTPGSLKTLEVRAWMDDLGVKKNIKAFEGSQVIGMKQRIVTTTDVFEAGYPAEKAVDRLAALGYEGIDMGFDYWVYDETSPFLGDGYLDWAKGLKARAEEKGVVYTHAHAPGRADSGDVIGRSIEAAAALGARYLVVHPTWQDKNGRDIRTKARLLSINAKEIKKWLPKAEACGVVLLSENVLWGPSADPRNIAALVQKVDSDWFGWCFDVGHAWCSGYGPEILKQCAVVPLSLHIQDNDGSGDGHLIPGDGTIDWAVFTKTLREIGYLGDCVMEAHHQSLVAPDAERDAILSRLLDVSKQLRSEMEA